MKKQKIIIIAGPTASGKSGVALKLAQKIKGEIVNADAFQVYQGLQILTARPTLEEMQGISHHLYGYVDNFTQEDVIGWGKKIVQILPEILNPIVVGGTGFYLSVLMNGISPVPDVSPEIRQKVRQMSLEEVKKNLKEGFIPKDIQRQKRALEVFWETGHTIDYFQNQPKKKIIDADFQPIVLLPNREKIYDQIEKRLKQMFQAGCVAEVENLLKSEPTGGVLKAIGVKELIDFIKKKENFETTFNRILLATRHYAKRQTTWFKHQMPEAKIVEKESDLKEVITL